MTHDVSSEMKEDEEREVRVFLLSDCLMSTVPTKSAWMSESYKVRVVYSEITRYFPYPPSVRTTFWIFLA